MDGGAADGARTDCRECSATLEPDANFCPDCGAAAPEDELDAYCRTCGAEYEPDDRFCSECGAVRNPDAEHTAQRPGTEADQDGDSDQKSFRRQVKAYLANGWDVEHDYGDSVVLVDRDAGNIGVHLLLLLVTGGLGNLVYAWYRYSESADRVRISADGETPAPEMPEKTSSSSGRMVGGALLLVLGVLMIATNLADVTGWVLGLGLLAWGFYAFPPTRRRLENRHSVTEFGTVQSTEETVVEEPQKPCVVCGTPIEEGIRRDYSEQKAVAGVPLFTTKSGENHYCTECAAADRDPIGATDFSGTVGTDLDGDINAMLDEETDEREPEYDVE